MLRADQRQQQGEVVPSAGGVARGIGIVDVRIALLDVDDEVADHLGGASDGFRRHLQRCLRREVPALAANRLELGEEVHPQQRLAAAEADAAARGDEVEVVHPHVVVQLLRRKPPQALRVLQTTAVQAVPAPQRTAVEGRQGGHPHPVDAQPVTVDAYERYTFQFENRN